MSKINKKLADFSIEALEERKEFTFYCVPTPPDCGDGGNGDGGNGDGGDGDGGN